MKQEKFSSAGQQCNDTQGRIASTAPIIGGGQMRGDNHIVRASPEPNCVLGHPDDDNQIICAQHATPQKVGQNECDPQRICAHLDPIIDTLIELHRQRQDLHRAEKSLTLQIKAKCRRLSGGDKTEANRVYKSMLNGCEHELAMYALMTCTPFISARALLEQQRKDTEKQMVKQAKLLPVYPWVESVRGFGALGFAQIVGEAGNLSNYGTVAKLWKRLGLAVIDGGRQRRVAGPDALLHGYSPSRRSVVWNIGDSLFRANGPYSDLCRERKEYEREKAAEQGLTVCPAAKIPAKDKDKYRSDGHVHNRAKRYMEKRLTRDLWRAWRDA